MIQFANLFRSGLMGPKHVKALDDITSGATIHAAPTKNPPDDADELGFLSNSGWSWRRITWANFKATLKSYFDTLYIAALGTTTFGRSLLAMADAAAVKTSLSLSKGDVGLGNVDNTSDSTKNSATATLTNKRVPPRVNTIVSNATPTTNSDSYDVVNITALATNITNMSTNLSGTPSIGEVMIYMIKDNGTSRTINWGSKFSPKGTALPTSTVAGKLLTVSFMWNGTDWGCTGMAQEA